MCNRNTMYRTYSELITFPTLRERYEYLRCQSKIGDDTFGWRRFLNQKLYTSKRWRKLHDQIVIRDNAFELGINGIEINGPIIVHHINPITYEDVLYERPCVFDLDNLISCSDLMHKAIHYGSFDSIPKPYVERFPGDTKLW